MIMIRHNLIILFLVYLIVSRSRMNNILKVMINYNNIISMNLRPKGKFYIVFVFQYIDY